MKKIIIEKEHIGKRLDKFLSEEFFSMSRGEIIRQIRAGKILVNEKSVKPSYVLSENDEIEIDFKEEKNEIVPNDKINLEIIYENENIVTIDKPAGIQMHPSAVEKENTVANWFVSKYPKSKDVHDGSKDAFLRPGIVHRLDKNTSGVVVIAKNKKSFLELKNIFKKRKAEKKYIAVVYGNLEKRKGIIEAPIARANNFRKQKIAFGRIKGKAREAITEYKVLKRFKGYDLTEVSPKTGRMHQIRVHMASIGHPVVGDRKYMAKSFNKEKNNLSRHLLHAKSLKFELFGNKYLFSSNVPDDFDRFLTPH